MITKSQNLPKSSSQESDQDDIDLMALAMVLLRGWKVIIACALLGLVLALLYSRYVNPTFKSDALIQIDDKSQGIAALGQNISDLVSPDVSPAQTEAELIKSRMVLEPVVNLLHLDIVLSDPAVGVLNKIKQNRTATQINIPEGVSLNTDDGQARISQFKVATAYLNQKFQLTKTDTGFVLSNGFDEFKGQLNQSYRFRGTDGDILITVNDLPDSAHTINITKQSLQVTTDGINGRLSVVEKGKQTGIIQMSLTGNDQKQVSRILEQIVLSYVDQNQSRGSEETTKTISFMETQIPTLKQKLEDAESKFNQFRTKYGTIDVSKEAELLLTENSQIDSQLNELRLKKADLTTYYTEEHPMVVQINEQLAVLNDRKQEIDNTVAGLPEIQREFLQLSEDVAINREIYLTMLKNYEQLKIVRAGQIGYARIVDLPISTFKAIAPKKLQIIVLGLLLGAILGTIFVLVKSLLRKVVKDPEHVEETTGVPVIATIPRSSSLSRLAKKKNASNRLLAYVDNNSLSYEAIKSLRTYLMFGMPEVGKLGHRAKVILISGESPGVGKSFIAANLAEVFGQLNKKVLVIDADMRLGEMHRLFNMEPDNGLAELLSAEHIAEDSTVNAIHPTAMDHIDFMPRGKQPHNPVSLLTGERFDDVMQQLSTHYDYIIIDSPPVLAASDPMILSQYADKVLMVTRYDKSIEGQLNYAIKQMNKANIQIDGIVLNDVQQTKMSKYSYHYNYAYGNNK
ncbi:MULTISPECIES: polysaccharide biosynthesis tyrosine autokinase [unclassified Psychrobacter]|uniref:polysaccharide biosynthesis tyrosine autokinase n=1 Tax=unclassified Psychrobacter TaxID=196806 RepID=UPI0018F6D1B4|nr:MULTISPECIES: polysaccharide biosynthesis tyrosine autokinase [unclassified Psychrobacter]